MKGRLGIPDFENFTALDLIAVQSADKGNRGRQGSLLRCRSSQIKTLQALWALGSSLSATPRSPWRSDLIELAHYLKSICIYALFKKWGPMIFYSAIKPPKADLNRLAL